MEPFNHHHHPRSEPLRWLDIAEKLLQARDLVGSKSFATRARESDPRLDQADQILAVADTLRAAEQPPTNNHLDWYSILQLAPRTHDSELISTHYRRLSRLLNPNYNKFAFADQAFKLVNDAWSVLSNPSRKFHFDSEITTTNNSNHHHNGNDSSSSSQFGFGGQEPHTTHYNFIKEQPGSSTTHYNFIQEQPHHQQLQFLPSLQSVNLRLLHHDTTISLPTATLSRGLLQQQQQHLNWPTLPQPHQEQQQQPLVSTHQLQPQQFFPQPQPPPPPPPQVVAQPQPQPRLSSPQAKQQLPAAQPEPQPRLSSPQAKQQQPAVQPQPQPRLSSPQAKQQQPAAQPQQQQPAAQPQQQQPAAQPQQQQPSFVQQQQQQQQQQPVAVAQPQPQQTVVQPQPHQTLVQTQPQQPVAQPQPQQPVVQPQSEPRVEPPVSQTQVDGEGNGGIPEKTFWTACPYCYNMYEYNVDYAECTLRCQNCKRAFHAAVIADPPMISEGKEASFCCWVNFPFGVSMSYLESNKTGVVPSWTPFSTMFAVPIGGSSEKNEGKRKKAKKNSGPRIYVDEDHEVFVELSSSGSDDEWGSTRRTKKTKSAAGQGRSQEEVLYRRR